MADTSLFYYNDQWGKVQPRILRLQYNITGTAACSAIVSNSASMPVYAAISAQATIDDFLGTTDEFTVAQFNATALGADAFGVIANMQGQCAKVVQMVARCYSNTGGADLVTRQCQATTLAGTLITACQVGAYGNIGLTVVYGNSPDFDGLTAGTIDIEVHWIAK